MQIAFSDLENRGRHEKAAQFFGLLEQRREPHPDELAAPDDVAQDVAFLISNRFMRGQVMMCDGGFRLAL